MESALYQQLRDFLSMTIIYNLVLTTFADSTAQVLYFYLPVLVTVVAKHPTVSGSETCQDQPTEEARVGCHAPPQENRLGLVSVDCFVMVV